MGVVIYLSEWKKKKIENQAVAKDGKFEYPKKIIDALAKFGSRRKHKNNGKDGNNTKG